MKFCVLCLHLHVSWFSKLEPDDIGPQRCCEIQTFWKKGVLKILEKFPAKQLSNTNDSIYTVRASKNSYLCICCWLYASGIAGCMRPVFKTWVAFNRFSLILILTSVRYSRLVGNILNIIEHSEYHSEYQV